MNAWIPVLRLARRNLIMLAVVVVLSAAAVYGFGYLARNLQELLAGQQASLQEQQTLLETHQNDLSNVRTHIKAYENLRTQGLVGEPDRAQWVEHLQDSHLQLGLPGKIGVELQAAKPLAGGVPESEASADPAAVPIIPLSHDLKFELRDVHEGEVLALLKDFHATTKARFRVDSCLFNGVTDSGLTAQCTLRFVTIPATIPVTPTAPAPAPAASAP